MKKHKENESEDISLKVKIIIGVVVSIIILGIFFLFFKEISNFRLSFESENDRYYYWHIKNGNFRIVYWILMVPSIVILWLALSDKTIIGVLSMIIIISLIVGADKYNDFIYTQNYIQKTQSISYEKIRVVVSNISPIQKSNLGKVIPLRPTLVTAFDGKDVIENIVLSRDRNSIKLQDTVVVVKEMKIRDFDKKVLSVRYSL